MNTGSFRHRDQTRLMDDPARIDEIIFVIHRDYPEIELNIIEGQNVSGAEAKLILLSYKYKPDTLRLKPQLVEQLRNHIRKHHAMYRSALLRLIATDEEQAEAEAAAGCPMMRQPVAGSSCQPQSETVQNVVTVTDVDDGATACSCGTGKRKRATQVSLLLADVRSDEENISAKRLRVARQK